MNATNLNEDDFEDKIDTIVSRLDFYTMMISVTLLVLMTVIAVLIPADANPDNLLADSVQGFLNLFCDLFL
jgi:hypothetical protein